MKNIGRLIVVAASLLFFTFGIQAQSDNRSKAKSYYLSAQEYFNARDYVNALNFLQSAENMLGKSNARIEALRAKTLHHKGDIEGAKRALDRFHRLSPKSSLVREMAAYDREIEARYAANKTRIAAARRAKAAKEREARIAADKRAREQAATAAKKRERSAYIQSAKAKVGAEYQEVIRECQSELSCKTAFETAQQQFIQLPEYVSVPHGSAAYNQLLQRKQYITAKMRMLRKAQCDRSFDRATSCFQYADLIKSEWHNVKFRSTYPHALSRTDLRLEIDALNGTGCSVKQKSAAVSCEEDALNHSYTKSCAAKNGQACSRSGDIWVRRSKGFEQATFRYSSGCIYDYPLACQKASNMHKTNGQWTGTAIRYAHKACELGWARSCLGLAKDARRGNKKMKKSKKSAKSYINKYCALKEISEKQCKAEYKKL